MEYNTNFIKNLKKINDKSDTSTISITIHDYVIEHTDPNDPDSAEIIKDKPVPGFEHVNIFPLLITKYKIQPGLIARYKNRSYAVRDRNLTNDGKYKDDVTIDVNSTGLSFNRIKYFKTEDSKVSYGDKSYTGGFYALDSFNNRVNSFPMLSEVSADGAIYDVFKLPWNIKVFYKYPTGNERYSFCSEFLPDEPTYTTCLFQTPSANAFDKVNIINSCLYGNVTPAVQGVHYETNRPSFLLLGLGTSDTNTYKDQYGTILTLWRKWIKIIRATYDEEKYGSDWYPHLSTNKAKQVYNMCNTFKDFVELIIKLWNTISPGASEKIIDLRHTLFEEAGVIRLNSSEISTIKNTSNYTSRNIRIGESGGISTRKHYLWINNQYNNIKLYINDKTKDIDVLGMFDNEENLCIFNSNDSTYPTTGSEIEYVYISNIGDISQKKFNNATEVANAVMFDVIPSNDAFRVISSYAYFYSPYIECTNFNEYDVGIIANTINYDVITTYNSSKKLFYLYKKINLGYTVNMAVYQLDRISSIGENKNINDELDRLIEEEVFVTPEEYYSNFVTIGEYSSGDTGFVRVKTGDDDDDIPKWFWSDTLKNWCIYKEASLRNTIKLCVWNGKNNWDEFEDVLKNPSDSKYLYDISHLKFGINFSTTYKYQNLEVVYKSVIMTYDNDFSQYTRDTYQTLRIGKMWSKGLDSETERYPFSIGIPPVMRLASGEIALMYYLTLPGVDKDHPLIYPEHIKFINDICRNYFGAGDDKTIKDDWKRVEKSKAKPDTASVIESMAESTVVDADEINTVEDSADETKLLFVPFKQYIETDNIETEGYVERWS